jgi:hypothetical protein
LGLWMELDLNLELLHRIHLELSWYSRNYDCSNFWLLMIRTTWWIHDYQLKNNFANDLNESFTRSNNERETEILNFNFIYAFWLVKTSILNSDRKIEHYYRIIEW